MPKAPKRPPTQRTRTGHEIPVPKRGEFYRDLERAVKAPPEPEPEQHRHPKPQPD